MDLSDRSELTFLSGLVADIRAALPRGLWLLVGAQARDLILVHGHRIPVARATADVDLGIAVDDWPQFEQFRQQLLAGGRFQAHSSTRHKLHYQAGFEVDLVPFGGLEQSDGTIALPLDGDPIMGVIGFQEALDSAIRVQLPDGQYIDTVCLPALVMLKIIAGEERHARRPGVDAADLLLLLSNYLECGNQDRLFNEHDDLTDNSDFDYEIAGAIMAGRDLQELLIQYSAAPHRAIERLQAILGPELVSDVPGPLSRQAPNGQVDRLRDLLDAFNQGLMD